MSLILSFLRILCWIQFFVASTVILARLERMQTRIDEYYRQLQYGYLQVGSSDGPFDNHRQRSSSIATDANVSKA